jgi:hypothetical protein
VTTTGSINRTELRRDLCVMGVFLAAQAGIGPGTT